jgi:DNA-binding protein HU-beta
LTKAELVAEVSEKLNEPRKNITPIVEVVFTSIAESLSKGEKCTFAGFGVFEVRDRAPRKGRNPRNPSKVVKIPARKVPIFRAGKFMKEKVLAIKKTRKKRSV